jgi:hypothetical protein
MNDYAKQSQTQRLLRTMTAARMALTYATRNASGELVRVARNANDANIVRDLQQLIIELRQEANL